MSLNPGIKDKNKIRAGAGLKLPPKPIKATAKDKAKAAKGASDFKKLGPTKKQQQKRAALKQTFGRKTQVAGKRRGGVMKAMGGKMAKGYSKGGSRMMRAMGGKMAKGYSKGGARMLRASAGLGVRSGRGTTGDKKPNMSAQTLKKIYNMALKNSSGDRMTVTDINKAMKMLKK
tara:strand:- start:242 stop:763 length:522 start_codon:yes stop_codon:yes gene_type:complete